MTLKLFSNINFFRVIICGILATTIGFQTLSQAFAFNFDLDYSIEWNDTSDSSETDKIDVEEKEHKKEFRQYYFTEYKLTYTTLNFSSYRIKKHPIVNIDINLPPPQKNCI